MKNAIPHDTFCSFSYEDNCHHSVWSKDEWNKDPDSAFDINLDITSKLYCKISIGNKIFDCIVEIKWWYPIKDDHDNFTENDCDGNFCRSSSTFDFCPSCFRDPFDNDMESICKFLLTGKLNSQLKYEHIIKHLSEDVDSIVIISATENTNKKSHIERSQNITNSYLRQQEDIQFQKKNLVKLQDELEELISFKLFYQCHGFLTSEEFDDYLILVHRETIDETKFNVQKCLDKSVSDSASENVDETNIPEKLANLSFNDLKDKIPRDTFCSFLCTNYQYFY